MVNIRILFILLVVSANSFEFNPLNFEQAFKEFLRTEHDSTDEDPDIHRSFEEMVQAHGYPLEIHYVTTSDGYVLKNYRIPGPKDSNSQSDVVKRIPVLLGHGLTDSSDGWIVNTEDLAPAYVLANQEYDVWLMNIRGNKHSKENTHLSPDKAEFWKFSFHENGLIDVPAVIDYIIKITGVEKIIYIGHSQGGSQIFALCSLNKQYCSDKIRGIVALAPAVYLENNRSPFLNDVVNYRLDLVLPTLGYHHLFDSREQMNNISHAICLYSHIWCDGASKSISEDDPNDNNSDREQVEYSHYPSGASTRAFRHFAAIIRNKAFLRLDNKVYYPLKNLTVKVHLFVGKHDRLVTSLDYYHLKSDLSNAGVLGIFEEFENMGHLTFLLSKGQENYIAKLINAVNSLR